MQYHTASVEFRLLQARHIAELGCRVRQEQTRYHQWVNLLFATVPPEARPVARSVTEQVAGMVEETVARLLGSPVASAEEKAVSQAQRNARQQTYLAAFGNQPYASLSDILAKVASLAKA